MHKKLFISYLTIILLAISISTAIFWKKGYAFLYNQSQNYYLTQAKLVGDIFNGEELDSLKAYEAFVQKYAKKYKFRITIIDSNGEVFADSNTDEPLENHKDRKEVIQALQGESVSVTRYSETMGQQYSYSAVPVVNNHFRGVLRISLPLSELHDLNNHMFYSIIYAILICFIIALITAAIFTGILAKPIHEVAKAARRITDGDYNIKIYTRDKSVVGKLAEAFNVMSGKLKENIESLTKRNAELEAILSSMTAGVVAIDDSNEIMFYNKAFTEIINQTNKELMGQSIYNVFRNAAVFDTVDQVRENRKSIEQEGTISKDGLKYIRVSATPLKMKEEYSFGVLLIIEDITKIKKLESIRNDFVSNVTHELKTPLTSIRGFIETLKGGAIKEEAVAIRFLDIIDIEAERLYNLIQDILLLSEIESKREYETIPYDINECVHSVIELLSSKVGEKVKIIYKPEPYIRPFVCNPDRMKQLFINLLDNAIKYTEEGSITINCLEKENNLILEVKDTGMGIEKEHLSRIFERFYRVDKGRSRKMGGTGLGLSIVKHIVELYNGNITVDSKPGEGSTFKINFPYPS